MDDEYGVDRLAERIAAMDPSGPILEVAATLPQLYRELVRAVGSNEGRSRFDQALVAALSTREV